MSKKVKFADFPGQWAPQKEEVILGLEKLLEKGDYILGKSVKEFEEKIASYCGTKYALGLNSGTDALFLSMKHLGIGEGDEVITVANSFIATSGSIVSCGAAPVFVDVGRDYLIDSGKIEDKINSKTKAIMPVHLAGKIADMDGINSIAKKHGIAVIEDACQAIGSEYGGKKSGSLGDFGCFSLHPLKILNVLGDGGFITLNDEEAYHRIEHLRNHGLRNRDEVGEFGYNSRLDSIHAAVALTKFKLLEENIAIRTTNAMKYMENLSEVYLPQKTRKGSKDNWNTFIIRSDKRDELHSYLVSRGIDAKVHYPVPNHLQPAARFLGYTEGSLPETEAQARTILSLPVHQTLSSEQVDYVIDSVNSFFK